MKLTILIALVLFSKIPLCQELKEYDLRPYNDSVNFRLLDEDDVIDKDESLEALIIVFKKPVFYNAELSLKNNPQLKEIKLFAANHDLLDFLSHLESPHLTHLFFQRFDGSSLEIPPFPSLQHLAIQSEKLSSLNMINSNMDNLKILDIVAPKLDDWVSDKSFPLLGLIHLNAPLLGKFPIENMPEISQFSYHCSFIELPLNLCTYKKLRYISFNNYYPVQVDQCVKTIIHKGVYSNLTIYDKLNGTAISQILSKDRKD